MVYGCGSKAVKFFIVLFNLLTFIAGLVILIVSAVAYATDAKQYLVKLLTEINGDAGKLGAVDGILIMGMIIGGVLVALGFLGCCGGLMESSCLLGLFAMIMILLILVQVGVAIAMLAFRGSVEHLLRDMVVKAGEKAKAAKVEGDKYCKVFKNFETLFQCCGADGEVYPNCGMKCGGFEKVECKDEIWKWIWSKIKIFGIVGLVFVVLELAAAIFAIILCRRVRYSTV